MDLVSDREAVGNHLTKAQAGVAREAGDADEASAKAREADILLDALKKRIRGISPRAATNQGITRPPKNRAAGDAPVVRHHERLR